MDCLQSHLSFSVNAIYFGPTKSHDSILSTKTEHKMVRWVDDHQREENGVLESN